MRKFDFNQLGGMPFYQNQFDFLQLAYREPIKALAALGGSGPYKLFGITESEPGIFTDGAVYYDGEVIPFIGGAEAATIVITTYNTSLLFADGISKQVMQRKEASFGTGDVQFNFTDLKLFQEGFGIAARGEWIDGFIAEPPLAGQYFKYKHDKLTNMVHLKGAVRHQVLNTGSNPIQMEVAAIPPELAPASSIYFNTSIETHSLPPTYDYDGIIYKSEVGRVLTNGSISLSQRRLYDGTSLNFLHYFYITYSKDI